MLLLQLASMRCFIPCDNWKALFFITVYRYFESFFQPPCYWGFFETFFLKQVRILRCLHNNSTIRIPRFQNKAVLYFICYLVKGALSGLRQFLATKSPLKMSKNALYFTLKALFVLKIFKFLS